VVTFEFRKIVKKKDVDTGLLRRILESELPNIAYKCIKMYTETLNDPAFRDKGIWSICPEYFRKNQEELKKTAIHCTNFWLKRVVTKKII
jgi:hypothetical protein